jgi:hypothetical protein
MDYWRFHTHSASSAFTGMRAALPIDPATFGAARTTALVVSMSVAGGIAGLATRALREAGKPEERPDRSAR